MALRAELGYDPEDLTRIDVFLDGKPAGAATPFITRRTCTGPCPRPPAPTRTPPGSTTSAWSPPPTTRKPAPGAKIDFTQLGKLPGSDPGQEQEQEEGRRARRRGPRTSGWPAPRSASPSRPGTCSPARPTPRRSPGSSFCVVESALGVVTGDVGAGKTVALRAAVAALDPTRHQVIYIANPAFGTRGLYVAIVRALGGPRYLKAELIAEAGDLCRRARERHRRVVLICDEAHLMQPDQLEELRLLRTPRWTRPPRSPASSPGSRP